ncbi:hypothetical protein SNE40_020314 [Patella caerulea]|uniref:SET domain-containing protein n=1 Tax=Patella caerulea TaxID=87958 RepID=A0AAN8GE08_PATCE
MKGRTWRKRKKKVLTTTYPSKTFSHREEKCLGQWMRQYGMKKNGLKLWDFPATGRGLMATQKINSGDIIISVPHHLLITIDTVLTSQIGPALKQSKPKLSLQQSLALFILLERDKGNNSLWRTYINTIPKDFTTPGYFIADCNNVLGRLKNSVQIHITKLRKAYKQCQTFCEKYLSDNLINLTFESFRWAWYAVNSRSIYYKTECCFLEEEDSNMALAPFLDLLNHSTDAKTDAGFNVVNNCYEIRTSNNYKKYDQVFISYGPHDNHKLFLEYGFILPNNPHTVLEFSTDQILELASNNDVHHLNHKWTILKENNLLKGLSCSRDGMTWKMELVFKILVMNWQQLQDWKKIMLGLIIRSEIDDQAQSLALILLKSELKNFHLQLQNLKKSGNYFEEVCEELLKEDLLILQNSIKCIG